MAFWAQALRYRPVQPPKTLILVRANLLTLQQSVFLSITKYLQHVKGAVTNSRLDFQLESSHVTLESISACDVCLICFTSFFAAVLGGSGLTQ